MFNVYFQCYYIVVDTNVLIGELDLINELKDTPLDGKNANLVLFINYLKSYFELMNSYLNFRLWSSTYIYSLGCY